MEVEDSPATTPSASAHRLVERYRAVRAATLRLCAPLATEDYVVQSMPDASPTKWHLAHTSWFFETLVLQPALPDYQPLAGGYARLFNSYYNTLGDPWSRAQRGLITRPTVEEIERYRAHVDQGMERLFERARDVADIPERLVELGIHHEQQHQELLLTDLKHLLGMNPLAPVYRVQPPAPRGSGRGPAPATWIGHEGGLVEIGHAGEGFAYDNETPRHRTWLYPFQLASRLVTCGEYLDFIADRGYGRPELWLSDGWDAVRSEGWRAPLYWEERDGTWQQFTLAGLRPVQGGEPVCHVSYYEADAFARWRCARLPSEAEWESIAAGRRPTGNFAEAGHFHPVPSASAETGVALQLFGDVWEWTSSDHRPYPGYAAPAGALGEYNAKFMASQYVLRGGSCATPQSHIRATYRNFFPPEKRWQFTGIRLAKDGA